MTLSITPGRSVDVDEVIDGLAPRDPAVEAEFLAAFYRFHREKTGEREATTRESLNKILSRSGKDFDVYGLYRGCCQRGGFHSREHAKRHMSFAEVYREMNNYDVVNTYTDMWKRLLDAYEKYLLAYEGEHPDDINADKCDVCEREDVAMIQCDHCETWTHEQCHRPRALQRQPIQYPEANAENTAGAGNTNTAGGADDRADSDSDQMNDLAAIAKVCKAHRAYLYLDEVHRRGRGGTCAPFDVGSLRSSSLVRSPVRSSMPRPPASWPACPPRRPSQTDCRTASPR